MVVKCKTILLQLTYREIKRIELKKCLTLFSWTLQNIPFKVKKKKVFYKVTTFGSESITFVQEGNIWIFLAINSEQCMIQQTDKNWRQQVHAHIIQLTYSWQLSLNSKYWHREKQLTIWQKTNTREAIDRNSPAVPLHFKHSFTEELVKYTD